MKATGTIIKDIHLSIFPDNQGEIHVGMPLWMNRQWAIGEITWFDCAKAVRQAFQKQIEGKEVDTSDLLDVTFAPTRAVDSCLVDVTLPNRHTMYGFVLRQIDGGKPLISTPKTIGYWKDSAYPWPVLCESIVQAYRQMRQDRQNEPVAQVQEEAAPPKPQQAPTVETQKEKEVKEKNELGRIINAENSSLRFYPRTVLRLAEGNRSSAPQKSTFELVASISKGAAGGLGPFEINILIWIAQLRYVTTTMLLDLIEHGYVSSGWRMGINSSKLNRSLNRMEQYNLIERTRFVTVDDDGNPSADSYSIMLISTLGKTGDMLLRELGKKVGHYNPFDLMQDGNTVKKILAANQWLIFWLTKFEDQIGDGYESSFTLYEKGVEFSGAKIYASVTVGDYPIMVEPIRRVEDFEVASARADLREKIQRLIQIFGDLDHLYIGQEAVSFPRRPIISLMCEDDAHILEIGDAIADIAHAHPEQAIWFTSDLRIYNHNMEGQRFGRIAEGRFVSIDLHDALRLPPIQD